MKRINMKVGNEHIELTLDEKNILKVVEPNKIEARALEEVDILYSIENPIGSKKLEEIITDKNAKIAIVTSDITRPFPNKKILPILLKKLEDCGVNSENIEIIFALGSHRKHTEKEMMDLVGEGIFKKYRCIDSDPENVVFLGWTKNGTPLEIFKNVAEADVRILLGNIEFHYFAGYSGGAKALLPGVSTRRAIQENHKMMLHPKARAGIIEGNPVREDIEEILKFIKVDFIINVVLDENKNIVGCFTGDVIEAHRRGCAFLDGLYKVELNQRVDVVFVSCGGYPKDINLYQAQKALDNCKDIVKERGAIVLFAECKEGFGERTFERWINEANSPQHLIEKIKKSFELGGHKAAAIAKVVETKKVFAYSKMSKEDLEKIFIEKVEDLNSLISRLKLLYGDDFKSYVIPYGASILPFIREE